MGVPNFSSRGRQPLSNSNAGPTPAPGADPAAAAGSDANVVEFNSREDVERLLNEKMKGKNKNDYKVILKHRRESSRLARVI